MNYYGKRNSTAIVRIGLIRQIRITQRTKEAALSQFKAIGTIFGLLGVFSWVTPTSAQQLHIETINAFSSWNATGQVFQTRPDGATFIGVFSGPLFIEEDSGPVRSGNIICPVMLQLNLETKEQSAIGKCTIVSYDGARAFAEVACKGEFAIGCDGTLTLVGGTGRLEGVSGGGPMSVRNTMTALAEQAGNIVDQASAGIVVWRNFKLVRPRS